MMILIATWVLNIFHPSFLLRPPQYNTNISLSASGDDPESTSNDSEKINRF